tara:strand:- start:1053 stop:1379 length:327 start_codon:yes stop_codon:yes gene_type:complete
MGGSMKNDWDGSTDWSEGSVFAMLGMAMKNEALQLEGFQLIYHEGHRISPMLKEIMYQKLVEADLLPETRMGEGENELRWLMPGWMEELEETIKDDREKAVEDLLNSI